MTHTATATMTLEPQATMTLEPQTTMTLEPQRMRALERANEVRLARARLKRQIADGHTSAARVILDLPPEARNWSVRELLMSQRRWGSIRSRKLLAEVQISELRPIGALTDRQRRLLAGQLAADEPGLLVAPS